jgi:hypothetical protein
MMANAAKITEMMKTAVVGGVSCISSPSLFVDERTVIVFSEKARGPITLRGRGPKGVEPPRRKEGELCVQ